MGQMGKGLRIYFHRSQPYLCLQAKFELARNLVEKVGQGQQIVKLCDIVNFLGLPRGRSRLHGVRVENLSFIDLNPTYVRVPNLNSPGVLWKKLDRVNQIVPLCD